MVSNGDYGNSGAPVCSLYSNGVCVVKPINGKAAQMTYWESDQFIVLMKQGNACGGKGLTEARMTSGAHLPHPEVECR